MIDIKSGLWIQGLEPLHSVKYDRFMYFTFITTRSKQQGASDILTRLQVFISEVKVRSIFILSQFQELITGRLVRASASSVLRKGDWSHMGNMTSPGFRPTPRGLEQFQACQDSFLLSSTTVSMTGVLRTQKDWYTLEASKKNKKTKFCCPEKNFYYEPWTPSFDQ